jgi:hypothetical protein
MLESAVALGQPSIYARPMATQSDVRRVALSLPGAQPIPGRFAFGVQRKGKLKAFVWVWMERVTPKKPRVPNHSVIAARVPDLVEKDRLLVADSAKFFTEPHYKGFPAVLVRLGAVSVSDLRTLLTAAWRSQAPVDLTSGAAASATAPGAVDPQSRSRIATSHTAGRSARPSARGAPARARKGTGRRKGKFKE